MNTYSFMVSNSSELSLHIVGGYGILAIPSKLAVQSWQSGGCVKIGVNGSLGFARS